MAPKKQRADALLVERNQARDLKEAGAFIMAKRAMVIDSAGRERKIEKAGEMLPHDAGIRILGQKKTYVSRAGEKLEAALDAFAIDVSGRICADIGLSTGGFTDCLLSRGASRVHGVDVAYGIVDWSIRNDPRVRLYERTNARTLPAQAFGELVDLAVVDVSFISLALVLPAVIDQLSPDGQIVVLVKPQFELPKEDVEGGVVRDEEKRRHAVEGVVAFARTLGLDARAEIASPIAGAEGNIEVLVHLVRTGRTAR
jgi:23S rRNA (cytidine1920-2'-O)/16S rRNA (cytidine1409-2'-O)-methyltransferase